MFISRSVCVCVTLAVFASVVPRSQYSQHIPSPLADEHALIASYVARLRHCARSVGGRQPQAGVRGLSKGRESYGTWAWPLETALRVGFFLRSCQLCWAEFR